MKSWKRGFSNTLSNLKFVKERPGFGSSRFKRNLLTKIFPIDFPMSNLNPVKYVNQKFKQLVDFYEEFIGLKDVRLAQEKVEELGEKLEVLQSERRQAFAALSEIQSNLKTVYAQLEYTRREDDRYLYLITEEHKLLKQEEMQQKKFRDIERAERDQFTLYSNSVKTAHEKEKVQTQKTKYWSLIGSLGGTVIGIIGTSWNSHRKQSELKKLIAETLNSNLEAQLNKYLLMEGKMDGNEGNRSKVQEEKILNEILLKTNRLVHISENTLKLMQSMGQFEANTIKSDKKIDALFINSKSFKDTLSWENQQIIDVIWKGSLIICGALVLKMLFSN